MPFAPPLCSPASVRMGLASGFSFPVSPVVKGTTLFGRELPVDRRLPVRLFAVRRYPSKGDPIAPGPCGRQVSRDFRSKQRQLALKWII